MVQPAGMPVCCASGKKTTVGGTVQIGRNLDTAMLTMPVLPTANRRSLVAPTATIPEFEGSTAIDAFDWPNALDARKIAPMQNNMINLMIFIFFYFNNSNNYVFIR